jgi:hypothetical protein
MVSAIDDDDNDDSEEEIVVDEHVTGVVEDVQVRPTCEGQFNEDSLAKLRLLKMINSMIRGTLNG